jgi:hypothetical protein
MWKLVRVFVVLILIIPVISWIVWKMEKDVPINLLVIDKTTPEKNFSEHLSFFWLANQNKWVKSTGEEYDFAEDFLGFHPDKDGEYVIKDLKIYGDESSERLADSLDVVFFCGYLWHLQFKLERPSRLRQGYHFLVLWRTASQ